MKRKVVSLIVLTSMIMPTAYPLLSSNIGENISTVYAASSGEYVSVDNPIAPSAAKDSDIVTIPDDELRNKVAYKFGKSEGDTITVGDMRTLTEFSKGYSNVTSIEGLQYAVNLTDLNISGVSFDENIISGLGKLESLSMTDGDIKDLSFLSKFQNLRVLQISADTVDDISIISSLINLENLYITGGNLENLSFLSTLVNLRSLNMPNNNITDVGSLSNLTKLENLSLDNNNISDISALSSLGSLKYLNIKYNNITDISSLKSIPLGILYAEEQSGIIALDETKKTFPSPVIGKDGAVISLSVPTGIDDLGSNQYELLSPQSEGIDMTWNESNGQIRFGGTITVVDNSVPATSINVDKNKVNLERYDWSEPLIAEVLPKNATNKAIEWSTLDNRIASVDRDTGKIYGRTEGTTKITATVKGTNITETVDVYVSETVPETPIDTISIKFTDIENHWGKPYIIKAFEKGLFKGVTDTLFSPDTNMTRAMFVTVLGRLSGETAIPNDKFFDVKAGEYYSEYVAWAEEKGIIKGYEDGSFRPDNNVTREEMAVIIQRYMDYKNIKLKENSAEEFKDIDSVSDWAKESVKRIQKAGIIEGKGLGIFDPKGNSTRAEVAKVLVTTIEMYIK